MNKREALQAMLEGKKITHGDKSGLLYKYIYMYIDTDGVLRYDDGTDGGGFLAEHIINTGWEIYEEPKKKVRYYRPNVIRNSNGKILKTRDRKFIPSKNAELYSYQDCDILDWEEIEVEE